MMAGTTRIMFLALALILGACGGGGGGGTSSVGTDQTPGCSGDCQEGSTVLTVADVETVIAQAVSEAHANNVNATIAVSDRVGNVLAVWQMAPQTVVVATQLSQDGTAAVIDGGLEGVGLDPQLPGLDLAAAIAKAVTGAYLSSEGNAFTTRTANQIVQDHFNPGEDNQPGGPLFGVMADRVDIRRASQATNGAMMVAITGLAVALPWIGTGGLALARSIRDAWPWFVLAGCCLFLVDVFVRRVAINFDWIGRALKKMRGTSTEKEATVTARLDALKKKKESLDDSLEKRRASVRFEPTATGPGPDTDDLTDKPDASKPAAKKTQDEPADEGPSYTERLLEAKRKAKK